jgi:hypothetical protein
MNKENIMNLADAYATEVAHTPQMPTPLERKLAVVKIGVARAALEAALEQPVQEPATCRFCHSKKGCWTWQCYKCGEIDDVQQPAPPAAQRKPLTDEQIIALFMGVDSEDKGRFTIVKGFARAIEAKLKENT